MKKFNILFLIAVIGCSATNLIAAFDPPASNRTVTVGPAPSGGTADNQLKTPTATDLLTANPEIGKNSDIIGLRTDVTALQTKTQNQAATNGTTNFTGILNTTGNVGVGGTLTVSGVTTLNGAANLSSTLGVTGATTIGGILTVNNNAIFGTGTSSTGTFKGSIYMNSTELVATQNWSLDTFFQVKAYQLYFDTTPTINANGYLRSVSRTLSIQAPYYLRRASNQTLTASTANTTNVLKNATAVVPTDWSTVSVVNVPNTTYTISAPAETRTLATNSAGNALPTSYTYYDTQPYFAFWSDIEFKIIRKSDGALVYWVSTQAGGNMGVDYFTHPARDPNAKIFYTASGTPNDGRNWIQRSDTQSTSNYLHAQSQSTEGNPMIGGVIIQPNLTGNTYGGTPISTFFGTNGANTPSDDYYYIFLKISPTGIERSPSGNPIWRPYNALSNSIQNPR